MNQAVQTPITVEKNGNFKIYNTNRSLFVKQTSKKEAVRLFLYKKSFVGVVIWGKIEKTA